MWLDPQYVTLHNIHYTNNDSSKHPTLRVYRTHHTFPVKVPFRTTKQTKEVPSSHVGQMGRLYTA